MARASRSGVPACGRSGVRAFGHSGWSPFPVGSIPPRIPHGPSIIWSVVLATASTKEDQRRGQGEVETYDIVTGDDLGGGEYVVVSPWNCRPE